MIYNDIDASLNASQKEKKQEFQKITIEEIVEIIKNKGIDPFATNAVVLREYAGHGSAATIQKHLKTIRHQIKPPPVVLTGTIPAASSDVVKMLWEAAYTSVQMQVLAKIEGLTVQRDQASQMAEAQASDIESFASEIDELNAKIVSLDEKIETMKTSFSAQEDSYEHDKEGWMHRLGESQSEIDFVRTESKSAISDARHAAEIAIRDATIREQAMQSTISNLINQVADLKSILIERSAPINQT